TEKAKDLVRMAVAKVRLVEPLQRKSLALNPDALVIGAGLSGMTAALELADQGFQVSLVEKQAELGGNMRHLHFLYNDLDPRSFLDEVIRRTQGHPNIHLFTGAQVQSFEGGVGKFQSTLSFSNGHADMVINHGITILATGGQPYQPTEYLYGQDADVLTQIELEEQLAHSPQVFQDMKSVVMIQCVGSRNQERPYCSRLCCNQAIKNSLELKRINPNLEVFVLYRDIRTYGLQEKYYRQARQAGVVFLRFDEHDPPLVFRDGQAKVLVHDCMLDSDMVLDADRVILSVATIAQPDAKDVAQLLKVPLTPDGFFQEAHMKLAPVDFATEGIYLCGLAHYPKKAINESMVQSIAAAGRAAAVLSQQAIDIEPTISQVVEEKCDGCAYCVDPCPYNAITLVEYQDENGQIKKRVVVDESSCKGCGTCQATCPKNAIFVWHFKLDQLRAMTMAALEN
ncbi:MAG: 4Fe-4S binding protein, partial [Anaerolineae bacterium]|nr:4Fe-4S binding protein [Anaerolineae bacterium]